MNLIGILTSLVATIVGALFAVIAAWLAQSKKTELEERKKEVVKQLSMRQNYIAQGLPTDLKSDPYRQELVYSWLLNVANSKVQRTPQVTQDQMKAEIEKVTKEVANRIDKMEKRLPSEATIDKVASVNDAILVTQIETLSESIKRIEDRLLTKWDVARIVFTIIANSTFISHSFH